MDYYHRFGEKVCLHLQGTKIWAAIFYEKLMSVYETTRRHILENCNLHSDCREELNAQIKQTT